MKIWIWGAGFAAKEFLENYMKDILIEGIIDNNLENARNLCESLNNCARVLSPQNAVNQAYDLVIVLTKYSKDIYAQAIELGFDLSKFLFVYENYDRKDLNTKKAYDIAEQVLGNKYIDLIKNRYKVIRCMDVDATRTAVDSFDCWRSNGLYSDDYVRIRTFELVVEEIKHYNISGNVAELGVFRGEFSRYINYAFSDRILYLFDTFNGFRENEAKKEKEVGNCSQNFVDYFKNTSMGYVMDKMPFPEMVKCYQGLFPESLNGLEDEFAFVSIDVDFEQAIYDGIEYFYPRMAEGGYIFIHDYNSESLKGVMEAVLKYEKKYMKRLKRVPICDKCGTVIIVK